jgi:hypothetical protein
VHCIVVSASAVPAKANTIATARQKAPNLVFIISSPRSLGQEAIIHAITLRAIVENT